MSPSNEKTPSDLALPDVFSEEAAAGFSPEASEARASEAASCFSSTI